MKLTLISLMALFFVFVAYPSYSEDPSLKIHLTIGTCFPEYVATVALYPQTKEVVYKLYSYKELSAKGRDLLVESADIPLMLVDTNGCA